MSQGVIGLSPRWNWRQQQQQQQRRQTAQASAKPTSKLQLAHVQAEGCGHGGFILHNHLAFGEGHLGAGQKPRTCSLSR